jgi:hypothetical protein
VKSAVENARNLLISILLGGALASALCAAAVVLGGEVTPFTFLLTTSFLLGLAVAYDLPPKVAFGFLAAALADKIWRHYFAKP